MSRSASRDASDVEDLRRDLFGHRVFAECLIAEEDGEAIGFALFFHNYSTFRGRPGLYLEDLFVKPSHRGKGIGKHLLASLARIVGVRERRSWAERFGVPYS